MELKFSHPIEFIRELQQEPPNIEPVLRATIRHQADRQTGGFRHLTVVASYLRVLNGIHASLLLVVTLESYQGEDWDQGFNQSDEARQRSDAILAQLRKVATELGLEFRPGIYDSSGARA